MAMVNCRSDMVEAWLGVAAAALLLCAVPSVGVATAVVAEHSALDQARGLHHTTAHTRLHKALAEPGPHLIEDLVPPLVHRPRER